MQGDPHVSMQQMGKPSQHSGGLSSPATPHTWVRPSTVVSPPSTIMRLSGRVTSALSPRPCRGQRCDTLADWTGWRGIL